MNELKLNSEHIHAYAVPEEERITIQMHGMFSSNVDITLEAAQNLIVDLNRCVERYREHLDKVRSRLFK